MNTVISFCQSPPIMQNTAVTCMLSPIVPGGKLLITACAGICSRRTYMYVMKAGKTTSGRQLYLYLPTPAACLLSATLPARARWRWVGTQATYAVVEGQVHVITCGFGFLSFSFCGQAGISQRVRALSQTSLSKPCHLCMLFSISMPVCLVFKTGHRRQDIPMAGCGAP